MNKSKQQKQREYARKYYEEHKEELRKKKNEYRKNNLDKYRKNQKKYYQNNKGYYKNYSKEWSKQKLDNLLKQLEAYENMRKELINIIEYTNFIEVETLEKFKSYFDNLMNILNKVGEDNDTR